MVNEELLMNVEAEVNRADIIEIKYIPFMF